MFGSFFIGLSGMQAYSAGLRQISNNITNLNSVGFKSADLQFSDVFGSGNGNLDNPGYGVSLDQSRLDLAQGELRQSNNDLDLAIDGDGFLVLLDDAEQFFARTGSFEVNSDGYIVLSGTDYRLTVLDESGNPTAVSIDAFRASEPAATTRIVFSDNLSSTATSFDLPDVTVYDASGEAATWRIRFERAATDPAGEWAITVSTSEGASVGSAQLRFNGGVIEPASAEILIEDANSDRSVILDFSQNVSSFSSGSVSTLRAVDVDGYGLGEITSITVNDDGAIEIGYSNEQTETIGEVTIATFRDPQALEQTNGGLLRATTTGGRDFLTSRDPATGKVLSNRIEASNVDLSEQFGDLILVQRGYQASSQVVSVSNDMVQQLFGLRGQG